MALLFSIYQSVTSQNSVYVNLNKNSYFAINGSTNVLPFKLYQRGEDLLTRNFYLTATQNQNKIFISENQLSIPVNNFNSDNKMALRDFKKLMKSDTYPNLQVQLNYFETLPATEKKEITKGNASVSITITGITKQFIIPVTSSQDGDIYSISGSKNMSIREFGLTPPVEMLGMIKVSEWIDIDFHLIGKVKISKSFTESGLKNTPAKSGQTIIKD